MIYLMLNSINAFHNTLINMDIINEYIILTSKDVVIDIMVFFLYSIEKE